MSDRFGDFIDTVESLRAIYDRPHPGAVAKEIRELDTHCRNFIALSPFVCIGTMSVDGRADVSPRGGEPGFIHVLADNLIAIPDRPGNNRLDSLANIIGNPAVGLLFFVPGFEDMLRANGTARISTDPELLQRFLFNGRLPTSVILVRVTETQHHCAKAIKRAGLWNPAAHVDRRTFPTPGQILRDHLKVETAAAAIDAYAEKDAKERLY
jgi:hypothetical protein